MKDGLHRQEGHWLKRQRSPDVVGRVGDGGDENDCLHGSEGETLRLAPE